MDINIPSPELPPLAAILRRFEGVDPALVHLTETEAAECLGQSPKTLESWRRDGRELPFLKLGRNIRYRLVDVLGVLSRNTFQSTRAAMTRNRSIPKNRGRRAS